jgi:hypothetical protein
MFGRTPYYCSIAGGSEMLYQYLADFYAKYLAEVSLEQIMLYSVRANLPIIAAGDLFDTRQISSITVQRLGRIIGEQAGLMNNYFIKGNGKHDSTEPPWMSVLYGSNNCEKAPTGWTRLSAIEKQPYLYQPPTPIRRDRTWTQEYVGQEKGRGDAIHGIDYVESQEKLQEKLDLIEPCGKTDNLLVLHQGLDGLVPHMSAELFDGMIPDGIDMVLCGHIHISGVTEIKTKSGKVIPLLSPGSLHLCSINEPPKKKMYCLGLDGSIWSTPLVTRRVIAADFCGNTEADVREATMKVVASLKKKPKPEVAKWRERISVPIVRVVYDSTTAPKIRTIVETALKEANAEAHLFYTNKTEKVDNSLDTVIDDGIDVSFINSGFDYAKAAFQTLEKDKKVRKIVETMLETTPSQENYTKLKEEFTHA